jgi:hypothetical protein
MAGRCEYYNICNLPGRYWIEELESPMSLRLLCEKHTQLKMGYNTRAAVANAVTGFKHRYIYKIVGCVAKHSPK